MRKQSIGENRSLCRVAALAVAALMSAVGMTFADVIPPVTDAAQNAAAIQAAIDAAASQSVPGTVTLGSGVFEVNAELNVFGGVTLTGQGMDSTVIKQTANGKRVATLTDGACLVGVTVTGGRLTASWEHGAGLYVESGTVSWCRVSDNKSTGRNVYGGGVCLKNGTIDHSIVALNQAGTFTSGGGGIGCFLEYAETGTIIIDACLVYGNTTSVSDNAGKGGGICYSSGNPTVTVRNTTITGNSSSGSGGGMYTSSSMHNVTLANSIVTANSAVASGEDLVASLSNSSSCNLVGVDPLFVDAANNNYRLGEESPAIRAGAVYDGIANDLESVAFAEPPSIGCYEYTGELLTARPEFSPDTGVTFSPSISVALSCRTVGANIYYTTDGTDPTDSSSLYSGPIAISSTTTFKARAYKSGMSPSRIATAVYTYGEPTAPELGAITVSPRATLAAISGEIASVGNNLATSCKVYIALGTAPNNIGDEVLVASGATTLFSYVISGLSPEKTYYYELLVCNDAMIEMSTTASGHFTTTAKETVQPVHSDSAATRTRIQDAIDGAALETPAGTVVLAEGLFEIDSQLMVTGGVTLVGQGWDKTVIRQTASGVTGDTRVAHVRDGATVSHVTITGGRVSGSNNQSGGGVLVKHGTVSWCCITNNSVYGNNSKYGGGIGFYEGKGQVDHCIIVDNLASTAYGTALDGGGIGVYGPSGAITIDSCLVRGNRSVYTSTGVGFGGGIGVDYTGGTKNNPVTVRNTTIVENTAGDVNGQSAGSVGGAVHADVLYVADRSNKFSMVNCIVAGNTTVSTNATVALYDKSGVDYCFFDVASEKIGANSKSGDPVFRNVAKGDFRLRPGSPCIDSGLRGEWIDGTSLSLDGKARAMGRAPDMGCYETCRSGFVVRVK